MKKTLFVLIAVLVCTPTVFSGIASVKNISFSIPGAGYYQSGSLFIDTAGIGSIQIWGESGYNYSIDNLTLQLTSCALQGDRSVPDTFHAYTGLVIGDFYGGATLTVSGDIRLKTDPEEPGSYFHSGKILEADMSVASSETWVLQQQDPFTHQLTAALDLVAVDGGLNTGIGMGNGDTMTIGDLSFGLTFFFPTSVQSFADMENGAISLTPVILLSAAEVPEPATLMLLGLGGLLLRRKK